MSHEQMTEQVYIALTRATWPDGKRDGFPTSTVSQMLARFIVRSILPEITTVDELEALPVGSVILDSGPDGSWSDSPVIACKTADGDWQLLNDDRERRWRAFEIARDAAAPLTVVWQP